MIVRARYVIYVYVIKLFLNISFELFAEKRARYISLLT